VAVVEAPEVVGKEGAEVQEGGVGLWPRVVVQVQMMWIRSYQK
jgi:hypothetical protein